MYHTIIAEDDPMVASINQQYLLSNPKFVLDGCFSNGQQALDWLRSNHTDLAIIDYYMPIMNGLELVRSIRAISDDISIIMVTAANNAEHILPLLSNGVLDYIVKPFTYDRFALSLNRFDEMRSLRDKPNMTMSQSEIDRLISRRPDTGADSTLPPVKGIQPQTLQLLRDYLQSHSDEYLTSDEIAKGISLSRITARRYLNYLLENQEIVNIVDYSTGGRPSLRYRLINP